MTVIPEGPLRQLQEYGFTTAEEVFYLAQAIGPELADLIGIAPVDLQAQLAANINRLPQSQVDALQAADFELGVPISLVPPIPLPLTMMPVAVTSTAAVNHIPNMPPVRQQGSRGTCVAHAALAVLEHALEMQGAPEDLSEQFLYWDCKQHDGIPNTSGTWLRVAFPLIERDGTCPEADWPYVTSGCSSEGCGPPPVGAFPAALPYRRKVQAIPPTSISDIKAKLASGNCVAFSVPVFRSWFRSVQVRADGKINMPLPNDILEGGHAMCFVGYEDSQAPGIGGGRFLLRNSWGTTWAPNSVYGAGYGSIPYAYIARYCQEAYSLP